MRALRPSVATDAPVLAALLRAEGIPDDEMVFAVQPTYVLEEGGAVIGFVTLGIAYGLWPEVVHLVIDRAHRNAARARFLGKTLRILVRESGAARLVMHACEPASRRLIEYYFRVMPYAYTDTRAYYIVTV